MKFIALLCILFFVKVNADDVEGSAQNDVASQFSEVSKEMGSQMFSKLNDEIVKFISDKNESNFKALVPAEIIDTLENITTHEQLQLFKTFMLIGVKAKTKGSKFSKEDVTSAISKIPSDIMEKLKNLRNILIEKSNKVSDGVKEYFKNIVETIHQKYDQFKNAQDYSSIPESEKIQTVVKLVQGYLSLTEEDRNSIGEAFESLKNLVNNEKFLGPLRSLNENSTVEDLANVQNQIYESLVAGDFNPNN